MPLVSREAVGPLRVGRSVVEAFSPSVDNPGNGRLWLTRMDPVTPNRCPMELHGSSQKTLAGRCSPPSPHRNNRYRGADRLVWPSVSQARAGGHLFDHHCDNCRDVVLLRARGNNCCLASAALPSLYAQLPNTSLSLRLKLTTQMTVHGRSSCASCHPLRSRNPRRRGVATSRSRFHFS